MLIFSTCVHAEDETKTVSSDVQTESFAAAETQGADEALPDAGPAEELLTDGETAENEAEEDALGEESPEITEPEETSESTDPEEITDNENGQTEEGTDEITEETEDPAGDEDDPEKENDPAEESTSEEETEDPDEEAGDPEEEKNPAEDPETPSADEEDPESTEKTGPDDTESKSEKEDIVEEDEETEVTVKKADATAAINVVSKNANIGWYKFSLTGLEKAKNVTGVRFAVWCADDQSDLKWYTGSKQSDGTYRITMYKYLHQDHTGDYAVHAYADYKDGSSKFVAGLSFWIKNPDAVVSVTKNDDTYHFEAKYIPRASEISYVRFAVWSSNNGKDDIKYYDAASFSKKTVKASRDLKLTNHKDAGLYYARAYGYTESGKKFLIAGTTFNVTKKGVLSCSGIKTSVNKTKGIFAVTVKDLHSPSKIKNVKVAVWCAEDQSDLVWYTMKDKGNGTYSVSGNVSKHNYSFGTYNAHVYVTNKKGSNFLIGKKFSIKASAGKITVGKSTNERKYPVTIKSVVIPGGVKGVKFAVWSDAGGQNDIVWYTAKETTTAGKYKATVDILKHKTAGTYQVHAYGVTKSGSSTFLGSTMFTVSPSASVKVTKSGLKDANGKFKATVGIVSSSSTIEKMKFRVWCKSDFSDVYWYKAVRNSSGKYVININTMNHYGHRGTYHIDVFAVFANGIEMQVAADTQYFKPEAYLKLAKSNGTSIRKVTYYNPDVTSVKFHVWTLRGGDKDKKIYTGKKSSDGVFYTKVNMDKFTYDGQYTVEVYSGSTKLDSGSFIMIDYLDEGYKMALDDTIGYSQINRCLNPDVDCSSFVYYSLKNTGYNVPDGWPMTTYSEEGVLKGAGFTMFAYTGVSDLQPGDILLRTSHTEIYAGNGRTVGAHEDENGDIYGSKTGDQTKREVSEVYLDDNWLYVFRLIEYPM